MVPSFWYCTLCAVQLWLPSSLALQYDAPIATVIKRVDDHESVRVVHLHKEWTDRIGQWAKSERTVSANMHECRFLIVCPSKRVNFSHLLTNHSWGGRGHACTPPPPPPSSTVCTIILRLLRIVCATKMPQPRPPHLRTAIPLFTSEVGARDEGSCASATHSPAARASSSPQSKRW